MTRKQTDLVTVYFSKPLQRLAFTELERRECKRLVCSFLSKFRQLNNTEKYSSGDVCERCRWQSKRAIRSGSGQNLAKRTASNKFWAPQQDRRGAADSDLSSFAFFINFIFFYGEVLKWSKRRDSKFCGHFGTLCFSPLDL